jgi:tRNA1Val (adenine37-N6)-methyltransferase
MKVGTDGVLLGAWVEVCLCDASGRFVPDACVGRVSQIAAPNTGIGHTSHIASPAMLDVGTGTGLIALMIAQRNRDAVIDAIEIDREASRQAIENVENSVFKDRIRVLQQSFFEFTSGCKYDLIISNPPFFMNDLRCPDKKRNMARHNDSLPLKQLIGHAIPFLTENGRIALILPALLSDELDFIIATQHLFVRRRTDVMTVEGDPPKRFLIEITVKRPPEQEYRHDMLVLETKEHERTAQYRLLTKDFYIQ